MRTSILRTFYINYRQLLKKDKNSDKTKRYVFVGSLKIHQVGFSFVFSSQEKDLWRKIKDTSFLFLSTPSCKYCKALGHNRLESQCQKLHKAKSFSSKETPKVLRSYIPFLSSSTCSTTLWITSWEGFNPKALHTSPIWWVSIFPSPFLSKSWKMSLDSGRKKEWSFKQECTVLYNRCIVNDHSSL